MIDYTNLFEKQSYEDALVYYEKTLDGIGSTWDYVILSSSNEEQARSYEEQISFRIKSNRLPIRTKYVVLPDPDGKRIGSGGATLNAIMYVHGQGGFEGKRILLIHSGGDSKRVPQYSACGKLFSPVPRILPDGRRSTLFDETMIGMSTVVPRIKEGMFVCSGDVLLLFNALQIDFYSCGAAALSIKENVETGKNHGVYIKDENGNVRHFLHKQTVRKLKQMGAVDDNEKIDIDTGAVILSTELLNKLFDLIKDKPETFINENVRLSFYADFLYPLASGSTLEEFYAENPEGDFTPQLRECRDRLWKVLNPFKMKLIQLSPASFIHFGTTQELLNLMTNQIEKYRFLGWNNCINSNISDVKFAASNSYISRYALIGEGSYIEDSYVHHGSVVGKHCIISGVTLNGQSVPDGMVLHGLKLNDGRFVVRMYSVTDNPKKTEFLEKPIDQPLWTVPFYPVCDTIEEAVSETLNYNFSDIKHERISLQESFTRADVTAILPWQEKLSDKIKAEQILQAIDDEIPVENVKIEVTPRIEKHLLHEAEIMDERNLDQFGRKIRIYYYMSRLISDDNESLIQSENCFGTIAESIMQAAAEKTRYMPDAHFVKEKVLTYLPVRVNWGGGWSDTPPYCMLHGGTVLNAAISIDGELPVEVEFRKIESKKFILASTDIGSYKEFDQISELQECRDPNDAFALHKAALIACGIIPREKKIPVEEICSRLGGGLYFNTRVRNIPKGSGLGTSSILAGASVKGLYEICGIEISDEDLYNQVLCMEQLMSTGGGWQDQVGGLAPGIKMVTSQPGLKQHVICSPVKISAKTLKELNERFCLIYTGQRRLARNLLRDVIGKYIGNNPESVKALYEIQHYAVLMRFELEKGNIDGFAHLLSEHWSLSKQLDSGCTNLCIEQILDVIDDLIDGKMICGAGGGGFLQVVLKKGVTKEHLQKRLHNVFQDCGVAVWKCEILNN